jgi:hypothetical protein
MAEDPVTPIHEKGRSSEKIDASEAIVDLRQGRAVEKSA